MSFRISKSSAISYDDPVALFNDLRNRKVPGLLAHQADVLRSYAKEAVSDSDVAVQLPTGSGKTLVGLLVGEWRRRKLNERVVYLCPTKQLVNQVASEGQARYGIRTLGFTGTKTEYDQNSAAEYLGGEAIAVTTYNSLFNIKPFFEDPQTIILDDAHSAENYISEMWSVRIDRFNREEQALFNTILGIFKSHLGPVNWSRFLRKQDDHSDRNWVDKIPTPIFSESLSQLIPAIEAHSKGLNLRFSWSRIKDHLHACHLYISTSQILIRPLIPPTDTHAAFANARQRVYMSATLGEGGELERLSGRKRIKRLPVPTDLDEHGIGRRLFLFPERSLKLEEGEKTILDLIDLAGRALVITPDKRREDYWKEKISSSLKIKTFNADDIEQSKVPFIESKKAAAIVANRYDGIDFPNPECALLVIAGLPRATNLQERFFIERMGASALLDDRILTRLVQAFGRCTRSPTDHAAVIVFGEEIFKYLMKSDLRQFLHPELQAELGFGIEQSKNVKPRDFISYFELFAARGDEWQAADQAIVEDREQRKQTRLPCTENLRNAVPHEIDFQLELWRGNFSGALAACRTVLGKLEEKELRGYRAMWNYLAASSACHLWKSGEAAMEAVSIEFFKNAMKGVIGLSWLSSLAKLAPVSADFIGDEQANPLLDRLEAVLERLGMDHDGKFEAEEKIIRENLMRPEKEHFEPAHERLGRLLGFETGNKESTGAPDPWWTVDRKLCFVFEDHSNGQSDTSISVDKARQAVTHPNWIKANVKNIDADAQVIPVLITPAKKVDRDALPHLEGVFVWDLQEFRNWANDAIATVREARTHFAGSGDIAWRATTLASYSKSHITPTKLIEYLRNRSAIKVLKAS